MKIKDTSEFNYLDKDKNYRIFYLDKKKDSFF